VPTLPAAARVVIVGAGIAGASVAWHLAQLGWRDVLLLEQQRLAGGTTWHAAGMVTRFRASSVLLRLNRASAELYSRLGALTGHDPGWRPVGSLLLARAADRMTQYRRTAAVARHLGVEAHELAPRACGERFPGLRADDLAGGFWVPGDGRVRPAEVVHALARGARAAGVTILEGVRVTRLLARGGRVTGVEAAVTGEATGGALAPLEITAEVVVLCGGLWTRQLALAAGVNVPLHPVEHHYVVSHPIPGLTGDEPCTRDMDGAIYLRSEDAGEAAGVPPRSAGTPAAGGGARVILGAFQRVTKVWDVPRVPGDFAFRLLGPDWEKFAAPLAEGRHRLPALAAAGWARFVNGPESFTPDNQWLMGETPELRGLFVLAGFNSAGIAGAGGAGAALAEWIVGGAMPFDLSAVDIRRFGPWANDGDFLRARVTEALGLHYRMAWPNREFTIGRGRCRSPLHDRLAAAGACFGVQAGWERPNWFAADAPGCAPAPVVRYSFGRQNWFENHAREHRAARAAVALFDLVGLGKIHLRGRGVLRFLQRLCVADVDVPAGRLVPTPLLNPRGGCEGAVVILSSARGGPMHGPGHDEFSIVTACGGERRDLHWLRTQLRPDEEVEIRDETERFGIIAALGPRAGELLSRICGRDFGEAAFPPLTWQRQIQRGTSPFAALRLDQTGEPGWWLHVSCADLPDVYDALRLAGQDLGLVHAGHYALESLRLEAGRPAFGAELSADTTPLEAGLDAAVAWDKPGGFLGREALLRQRGAGVPRRLARFTLDDPEPVLWGGEVIRRDGRPVGVTTSGAYGHTAGAAVGLGYIRDPDGGRVTPEFVLAGRYDLEVNGVTLPPSGSRM